MEWVRAQPPELLILDEMPHRGAAADAIIAPLRRDPSLCDLPILLLSCYPHGRSGVADQAGGADRCLIMPFNPAELVRVVRHLLSTRLKDEFVIIDL